MKRIAICALAVFCAASMISCNKETESVQKEQNAGKGKYTLTEITATNDNEVTKTNLESNKTKVDWRTGDRIAVVNTVTNTIFQYVLSGGNGTSVGRFTAVWGAATYDDVSDLVAVYPAMAVTVSEGVIKSGVNESYSAAARTSHGIVSWTSDSTCAFSNNDIKVSYRASGYTSGNSGAKINFKFKELGTWCRFVIDLSGVAYEGEKALSVSVTTTGGTRGLSGKVTISGAGSESPALVEGDSTSVNWTFSEPVAMSSAFTKSMMLLPCVSASDMLKITVESTMRTFTFYAKPNQSFSGGEVLRFPITAGSNFTEGSAETDKEYTVKSKTSNCYIVSPGKILTIPVTVKGNGRSVAGTGISTRVSPASVGIVWETAADLISLGTLSDEHVAVTAGSNVGNAVIAAYSGANQSGTILWSWHIWVTDYDPDNGGKTYSVTNKGNPACTYVFMDRNLGATSTMAGNDGTIGLQYQWGRKDPFTGSSSISSDTEITVYNGGGTEFKLADREQMVSASKNLSYSIENPEVFYKTKEGGEDDWYTVTNSSSSQNGSLWGGSDLATPGEKTIFDPCPTGWRVPAWSGSQSPWSTFTTSNFKWSANNYGGIYSGSYYPAAGARDRRGGDLYGTGSDGSYWSASPYLSKGYSLYFNNGGLLGTFVIQSNYIDRALGFPVRCVKE
ncbi:MAG: fibrobacter succinogenes major paralogous domain-containing protein [Bacteroidales bacterium]|nr:fibrobacter succinogenes major paralogous domain-containing protein [Bacteroidales bacterium]